jgi:outer membrane protein
MVVHRLPLPPQGIARAHQKHSTIKFLTCINLVHVAAHYARVAINNQESRFIMRNVKSTLAIAAIGLGLLAGHAYAVEQGSWLLRARAVNIDPVDKSDPIGGIGASDRISVSKKTIPEIDLSYFFTPNIAAELVLTYPQKHTVRLDGQDIGSFKHLPPTLTLQYHFLPGAQFSPYLGAGVNYTRISDVNLLNGAANLDRNSFGLALQAGVDLKLNDKWSLNFDVKKVQIHADVNSGGATISRVKLDPLLVGIGLGYRF